MVMFTGMGYFKSPEDAVKNKVRKTDYFYPEAGEAEIYKELYEKVYKQMYGRLKPIYKNIYEIING
jgi:sugar (pentulose or hexulose) kinase